MKTALYIRVSTENQRTGLESQQRALEEYCRHQKLDNIAIYTDEGISGAKTSRPALNQLMLDVSAGNVSVVLVYSFSRFARSTRHLIEGLEHFDKHNVKFVSLTEQLDTKSPSGRAIFAILAAISQLERELISERVRNGLVNARAKGKQLGAKKKHTNLEIVFHLKKQGHSIRQISKLCGMSPATVCRILKASVSKTLTTELSNVS